MKIKKQKGVKKMNFKIKGGNKNATITIKNEREKDGIMYFDVDLSMDVPEIPENFKVMWKFPVDNCYSVWSPAIKSDRHLGPTWRSRETQSRLASWMPLHTLVSLQGKNRMAMAVSDAKTPMTLSTGVCEHDACFDCMIDFFTNPVAPLTHYSATVRIDTREIDYYDSIYDVVKWWETECGYTPAPIPEHAKLPMNSLWYTYHQRLDVEDIIKECKLSKAIGMDTVIIDDGWQTDDTSLGYSYCGDWELATSKIPDMKEFVQRIHNIGMKVMLWYSVPYVGEKSKNYPRFKEFLLDGSGKNDFRALDPRYKEIREFLIDIYKNAVKDWNLDGLKLDFIDAFVLKGKSIEYDERRDYQSLEDAIEVLMTDIMTELRKINSDILIEFRETYVGPAIRKFGNMFRVIDCPDDALVNRSDIVNLRFVSGDTAVHSDMLMWNYNEPVEYAAIQFANILYSVPQISMKIDKLSAEHKKMLEYYLKFWRENKEVLIGGKLTAANPESCYSQVCAYKDGRSIITAYTDIVIVYNNEKELIVVNATRHNSLIVKNACGKAYKVINCMGEENTSGIFDSKLSEVEVPLGGFVFIR